MSVTSGPWRGFEGLAVKVDGGWQYGCDGMPTLMGCGAAITVTRRWTRVGKKKSGWVVMYGLEPNTPDAPFNDRSQWHEDYDVVLTFCPSCAEVMERQRS